MSRHTRRKFLAGSALLGASMAVSADDRLTEAVDPTIKLPSLMHTVFFWLKNPQSQADRDKLIEGIKGLAVIDEVRAIHVGIPAGTEQRDVVESSWHVSEVLAFDDLAGQQRYQDHPVHQQFVEECSHLWRKVVVYDAVRAG